jgi:hypothetical protein
MLARWGGENAHNYFLQVLVENGLIGFAIMGFAVITPFFITANRRDLLPSYVGLTGLLLANILAHSLLIRENLILAAVLLSLMYAWAFINPRVKQVRSNSHLFYKPIFVIPVLIVLFGTTAFEIYQSFYRFPYQTGLNCMVARPLTNDGWTSGIFEVPVPAGSHGINIEVKKMVRTNIAQRPLRARIDIVYFNKDWSYDHNSLVSTEVEWKDGEAKMIELLIPDNRLLENNKGKAVLRLSNCFSPRDLGINLDGRRLGIQIEKVSVF